MHVKILAAILMSISMSSLWAQEENIFGTGLPVAVISSKEHATLIAQKADIDLAIKKRVEVLCRRVDKSIAKFNVHRLESSEISNIHQKGVYRARVVDFSQEGIVLKEGVFPLTRMLTPTTTAENIEHVLYGSAVVTLVGGGLSTFLMVIGFEGGPDYTAATITGAATCIISAALAVGGLVTRWYRGRNVELADDVESLESLGQEAQIYAMPLLIDDLFCE